MRYFVEPVVCDYGIYRLDDGKRKLIEICNVRSNAEIIAEILNSDDKHKVWKNDLISRSALKEFINNGRVCDICPDKKQGCADSCNFPDNLTSLWEKVIDNAPTVEETEKPLWLGLEEEE